MDINLIDRTIEELESSETNFASCADLASLYIVRNYYKPTQHLTAVDSELADISPSYEHYKAIKREYQLGKTSEDVVITSMRQVCKEIIEFITALYCSAELADERNIIRNAIKNVSTKCAE